MNIELDDYSQTEAFEETELQESSKIETFEVTLDLDGERLDKVLASSLKDISRSRLKTLIEDGLVKVNGVTVDKPKEKMSFGDEVSVEIKPRLEDMDFIAAIIASVPPQVTTISFSGSISRANFFVYISASASRKFFAPKVMEYWCGPCSAASFNASRISCGGSKSGNP